MAPSAVVDCCCASACNIQDALLPRYRGPNATDWAFRNDAAESGVTIHPVAPDVDTGHILAQARAPISDDHGRPALRADHRFCESPSLNALDWCGTWKLLDALMACAYVDEWCEGVLGDTPEQRSMGLWSDAVPVAEAIVTDFPGMPTP